MIPSHFKILFTHLSQEAVPYSSGNTLDLDLTGSFENGVSKSLTVKTADSLGIEYENFNIGLNALSKTPCNLKISPYVRIPVKSFTVKVNRSNADSFREIIFDNAALDKKLVKEQPNSILVDNQHYIWDDEIRVENLPNVEGSAFQTTFVADSWEVSEVKSEALIPAYSGGLLLSSRIDTSMSETSLETVAWGLLFAVSLEDIDLIYLTLKELIYKAINKGWFLDSGGFITLVNKEASYFGFESFLAQKDKLYEHSIKEVSSNSLLGFAVCRAVNLLQDSKPFGLYSIKGKDTTFIQYTEALIQGLTFFVSKSVSPSTNLCAYAAFDDYYTYDSISVSASYWSECFLNCALDLVYDTDTHLKAGLLSEALERLPVKTSNLIYSQVLEKDLINYQHPGHPFFSPDQAQELNAYNKALILSAKLFWLVFREDYSSVGLVLKEFEIYRNTLDRDLSYADCLCIYAYSIFEKRQRESQNILESSLSDLLMTEEIPSTTVYNRLWPTWMANALSDLNDQVEGVAPFSTWATHLNFIYLAQYERDIIRGPRYHLNFEELRAQSTKVLLELRRMQPFGSLWFSEEALNAMDSVIGSYLYSTSCLFLKPFLELQQLKTASSPLDSTGKHALSWYNSIVGLPSKLVSESSRRGVLALYLRKVSSGEQDAALLYLSLFGREPLIRSLEAPSFYVYKSLYEKSDSSYTEIPRQLGTYLSDLDYFSIFYKKESGNWIKRLVPGLPIKEAPEEYEVLTEEDYLQNKEKRQSLDPVLIVDGEMFIAPLEKHKSNLELETTVLPQAYREFIDKFLPVGLHIKTIFINTSR